MITAKEIARLAGVTVSTVYRATHNEGRIADATRERILRELDALLRCDGFACVADAVGADS